MEEDDERKKNRSKMGRNTPHFQNKQRKPKMFGSVENIQMSKGHSEAKSRERNTSQYDGKPNTSKPYYGKNLRSKSCQRGGLLNATASVKNLNQNVSSDFSEKKRNFAEIKNHIPLHYKRLERLINEEISEILQVLMNPRNEFESLLKSKPRPDLTFLILKLIARVCDCDFVQYQAEILGNVCCEDFIQHLILHISNMYTERKPTTIKNYPEFLKYIFEFCDKAIELLPSTVRNRIDLLENLITVSEISLNNLGPLRGIQFEENLFTTVEILKQKIKHNILTKDKKNKQSTDYGEPPNDFRTISLYPNLEDLKGRNFLRPNIIDGCYNNPHEYLDIQFRLLREDFVEPLRIGINQYFDSLDKTKEITKRHNHHLKIYKVVKFLELDSQMKSKISYIIKFGDEKFVKKIKWEYTKRFLFGSLLLFSVDNFKTFFLGTVQDRKIGNLEKGILTVSLMGEVPQDFMNNVYVMAESMVFFEPYYQVLKALQNIPTTNLPLERYILSTDCTPNFPKYLNHDTLYNIEYHTVPICSEFLDWPTPRSLSLDESQFDAFKAALQNEFVVIQGPPGTGKTYIGLLIAKVLLKNSQIWNNPLNPLVVVCYTNHALDQFLEGLLSTTKKIIRIGGQSKNDNISEYNLQNFRRKGRRSMSSSIRSIHEKIESIRNEMAKCRALSDLVRNRKGILSPVTMRSIIPKKHFLAINSSENFQLWLWNDYIPGIKGELNSDGSISSGSPGAHFTNPPSGNLGDDYLNNEDSDSDEDNILRKDTLINDDLYDFLLDSPSFHITYEISFELLEQKIENLNKTLANNMKRLDSGESISKFIELKDTLLGYLQAFEKLKRYTSHDNYSKSFDSLEKSNLWTLEEKDRWALYCYWERKFISSINVDTGSIEQRYNECIEQLNEANEIEDVSIIKSNKIEVIGLTTTGAAKNRKLLAALKSRIVIVEEAAEVLEAHIVVALTKHCQHLILIGDHKQLRPNPATFQLAKKYNLDISLFERMLKNGLNCYSLRVQHRMRPNISSLLVPTIYKDLVDHSSVLDYPEIKGVMKTLFFIDHQEPEKNMIDAESHMNEHEGLLIISLCKYLIQQGYSAENITVLTTYSGQQFFLRNEKKKNHILKEVRITVVDNYQGEENKVILLSLVRSNEEGKIGFLKTENRVCVALSRAKHAFYIVGNMECLTKETNIWTEIKKKLESHQAIGPALALQCQIHKKITLVSKTSDFKNVMEGGCDQPCNKLLGCGHKCKKLCHIHDQEHENYKCFDKCERDICIESKHPCPRLCHEKCLKCFVEVDRLLPCGHTMRLPCHQDPLEANCTFPVETVLKLCEHTVEKPCYIDADTFKCTEICTDRLGCGHSCVNRCHKNDDPDHLEYKCYKECTKSNLHCKNNHPCPKRCYEECKECNILVEKNLQCGHRTKMRCSADENSAKCEKRCKRILDCGHNCKQKCFMPCGGCDVQVKKIISDCGHEVTAPCKMLVIRANCKRPCERILSCGHRCKGRCAKQCKEYKCTELVTYPVKQACGHMAKVPCYRENEAHHPTSDALLRFCAAPCGQELPCGDICVGTCGECMQGRIHTVCSALCGNILVCGHQCNVPCREDCPPCKEKCKFKCKHSRCSKKCGEPCKSCSEPCEWACDHLKCTKLCGEICDRVPCDQPCQKRLNCGHECVGLCGEKCPPLCRICDKEELTSVFFGEEDEEDSRFVYLEDCKHTIEVNGMDQWVNQSASGGKIGHIQCPRCKTVIQCTQRYINHVKSTYEDIQKVKSKLYGQEKNMQNSRQFLLEELKLIENNLDKEMHPYPDQYLNILLMVKEKLKPQTRGKKNFIAGISQLKVLTFLVNILKELKNIIKNIPSKTIPSHTMYNFVKDRIDLLLHHLSAREIKISDREIEQFSLEMKRLVRVVDFYKLMRDPSYTAHKESRTPSVSKYEKDIMEMCFSIKIFTKEQDIVFCKLLKGFKQVLNSSVSLTPEEKQMIHQAMQRNFHSSERQGHWFKCKNGHTYCITECGGAMETARCPEKGCGAVIGGQSHTLHGTNTLDRTMDGARHAAWSNQANMNNYHFDA